MHIYNTTNSLVPVNDYIYIYIYFFSLVFFFPFIFIQLEPRKNQLVNTFIFESLVPSKNIQVPLEHSFILLLTLYTRQTKTQTPKRLQKAPKGTTTATDRNRKITHWQEKLILINHTLANTNHSANRGFILL